MEEDIKILERITITSFNTSNIYDNVEKVNNAKEHLIARYKELEEKINILEQEKEYLNTIIDSDNDNYIPKSKVKEKIEELKNGTYDAKIILQQLLED